jgi:hypothetical protein
MPIRSSDLHGYALVGARAKLESLLTEKATLVRTFPELGRGARTKDASGPSSNNGVVQTRAGRRTMTAAQRKAVGERMAKYWAKRRKAKAGKGATAKAVRAAKAVTPAS